jgi:release factor glutamine methyltransferase
VVNNFSVKQLLEAAVSQLADSNSARLDVEILLSHVLKKPRSFLYTRPEYEPSSQQLRELEGLLRRRAEGEPVAYLTGEKEFWSLPFKVSRDTLIPRPETETLVAAALESGSAIAATPLRAIDLGTGSGCIALALAHERPGWEITAVDRSEAALAVARANAESLRIGNVRWQYGDWFGNINIGSFDLIVSNPPYIAAGDVHLESGDVRFEPRTALVGGVNGREAIAEIAGQSRARMRAHARLLLEIGHDQAASVRELLTGLGYGNIEFRKDLNGVERVCIASI